MSCYSQTCNQRVTGRFFAYQKALDIVNNHRYTDFFSDFDDPLIQRRFEPSPLDEWPCLFMMPGINELAL